MPVEQVGDWVPKSGIDRSYPSAATRTRIPLTPCEEKIKKKGKAVQLQAWSGLEGSRKLRFPDYMTTALDGWW